MFKRSILSRALIAAALCVGSVAASAASYTINFDSIAAGSNANFDSIAQSNGVSFASGHVADIVDADWNVIGQHWVAYNPATDGIDPAIFARNPSPIGWGNATSGLNALDATNDQVMVQFAAPTQLSGFSFKLVQGGWTGTPGASQVLFLNAAGQTIFTSGSFDQSIDTGFSVSFAAPLTVSSVLLPASKYYDDLSVAAVPEPDSYALFLAGLGLFGCIARRRSL